MENKFQRNKVLRGRRLLYGGEFELNSGKVANPNLWMYVGIVAMMVLMLAFKGCDLATAAEEDPRVDCIIGEASGEGMAGMLAVAQALKNRGTMRGVSGCKVAHSKHELQDTIDLARWAWMTVNSNIKVEDLVGEANSWGSQSDINKNHMDEKCFMTAKVGDHFFFKCDLGRIKK